MLKYLKIVLKKRRKSYVNNAWERVILPKIWVISEKDKKGHLLSRSCNLCFSKAISLDRSSSARTESTELYICIAIVKRAPEPVENLLFVLFFCGAPELFFWSTLGNSDLKCHRWCTRFYTLTIPAIRSFSH